MSLTGKVVEGRWHETVCAALPDGEVVFSRGSNDYQGCVAIVAKLADGRWLQYAWSYGSCSVCDAWEDEAYEKVEAEIRQNAQTMDAEHMADFLVGCMAAKADWLYGDASSYPEHTGLEPAALLAEVTKGVQQ